MIYHALVIALLVYIARKAQQLCRSSHGGSMTPWWYEITDAINRGWTGTF